MPAISTQHLEPLPQLYARWLRDLLPEGIPKERHATCDNCAMVQAYKASSELRGFHPSLKCCTYLPDLPNYLVGAILDEDPPASAFGPTSVLGRLSRRSGVSPLGFFTNPGYSVLYAEAGNEAFGRSPALLCPHFVSEAGQCSIWKHRNAVCSTYFCKHTRGAAGAAFWSDLKGLLRAIEGQLTWWCVQNVEGISAPQIRAMRRLTSQPATRRLWEELTGAELGKPYAELWGSWLDQEDAFYRRCSRLVDGLSWNDIAKIGGTDIAANHRLVIDSYERLRSASIPQKLSRAPIRIEAADPQSCQVLTYSQLDPILIRNDTLSVLSLFDGRPIEIARADIAARGVEISDSALLELCDWGILQESSGGAAGT